MSQTPRLPAEEGVWAFVFADMTIFALFFNVFANYRASEPAIFRAGQQTLNAGIGLANTLVLLTSSWLMVLGLAAVRRGARDRAARLLSGTIVCGLVFVGLKSIEYGEKIRSGFTPATDNFYMLYFVFTGIHLLHLIVGMAVLTWLVTRARKPAPPGGDVAWFEGGAVYWHMVDLLWIVLFSLIYLMR